MNAVDFLREWLISHYDWVNDIEDDEEREEELAYYGTARWRTASLKEMCQELHQIIWDEEHEGVIAVAGYFVKIGKYPDAEEVYNMFSSTREHSH